jgi:hypothetical protein
LTGAEENKPERMDEGDGLSLDRYHVASWLWAGVEDRAAVDWPRFDLFFENLLACRVHDLWIGDLQKRGKS